MLNREICPPEMDDTLHEMDWPIEVFMRRDKKGGYRSDDVKMRNWFAVREIYTLRAVEGRLDEIENLTVRNLVMGLLNLYSGIGDVEIVL